jgi:membrane-associated protease RseP (regulator of RpoE activity)
MAYRGSQFPDDIDLIDVEPLERPQLGYDRVWSAPEATKARRIPVMNIALFLTTLLTTTMAGATNVVGRIINPLTDPLALLAGVPFAATLMSVLLVHELGHYLVSRVHGVRATLPYFIPGPPFLIGTFGAFIRMKSPPVNRRALFDVGAAGPWAGVIVAVPAVIVGLSLSEVRALEPDAYGWFFGDSLLFSFLTRAVLGVSPDEMTILLHPVALAGWLGLFVTFLNLIPVGQLDGGHVSYALFGRFHRWPARAFLLVILGLGFYGWQGWFVWAILLVFLGVEHPPTLDRVTPLDPMRRIAAWATLALFAVTFIPVPFSVVLPPPVLTFEGPATPASLLVPLPAGPMLPNIPTVPL